MNPIPQKVNTFFPPIKQKRVWELSYGIPTEPCLLFKMPGYPSLMYCTELTPVLITSPGALTVRAWVWEEWVFGDRAPTRIMRHGRNSPNEWPVYQTYDKYGHDIAVLCYMIRMPMDNVVSANLQGMQNPFVARDMDLALATLLADKVHDDFDFPKISLPVT